MEVKLFPNTSRPGVGQKPRREPQRPLLPQHARHCPVLEAGSALGFLVYPPLEENETYHMEYQGDGQYRFMYFLRPPSGKWEAVFAVTMALPMGSVGKMREDVEFLIKDPPIDAAAARSMTRSFVVPEDLGTPEGGISLRGATNFRTPEGWDTIYTSVFNQIERPIAPMMVIRVETDWYAHQTEFRYVLQPGEGIPGSRTMPIGQVFFVPREEVVLGDCSEKEIAAIHESMTEFFHEKTKVRRTTPYGLEYSPLYSRRSQGGKPDKGGPEKEESGNKAP